MTKQFKTRKPFMKRPKKADHTEVTTAFLQHREAFAKTLGFEKQRWVHFCEVMLERGYRVTLYEAKQTVSKYVTVHRGDKRFKVRFSNHKPIERRELAGDCDFFVGITNLRTTTTNQAIAAAIRYFEARKPPNNTCE